MHGLSPSGFTFISVFIFPLHFSLFSDSTKLTVIFPPASCTYIAVSQPFAFADPFALHLAPMHLIFLLPPYCPLLTPSPLLICKCLSSSEFVHNLHLCPLSLFLDDLIHSHDSNTWGFSNLYLWHWICLLYVQLPTRNLFFFFISLGHGRHLTFKTDFLPIPHQPQTVEFIQLVTE